MKRERVLNLEAPVLFVNPPANSDQGLIEEVFSSGGLGIVDHVNAGPADFVVEKGIHHGIRVSVRGLKEIDIGQDLRLIIIPYEETSQLRFLADGELAHLQVPVFVEVGAKSDVLVAEQKGASGFIARAYEGPGWVSPTTAFVLFQEILSATDLPVFLRGGVSLRSCAGIIAAGGAGVVLDVHLWLSQNSRIEKSLKTFLSSLSAPSTAVLAERLGKPLRVYSRVATQAVKQFMKSEYEVDGADLPKYEEHLREALKSPLVSLDSAECLLPFSDDLLIERQIMEDLGSAAGIVREFASRMSQSLASWPFREQAPICALHSTRFPIVQGPMAHVSDTPCFLKAVAESGALPFLALGNMPGPIARSAMNDAHDQTGGNFGVGLIGLEVNRNCFERHLAIMAENRPKYCILAAGSVELAKRIEEQGTVCYLHCPSPAVLIDALRAGLKHFVWEGCESGGHIGLMTSIQLWTLCLNVLAAEGEKGLNLDDLVVLFAGGIGSPAGAAFIGGMASDLASRGLSVGLQVGTAYLTSSEAVSTGAITALYQKLTLDSSSTMVLGRTVNTRARAACSPMASKLISREQERMRERVSLQERKELYEKDNLGALRLASKGCAIDPSTSTSDFPVFCQLEQDEQLEKGLFLMGQAVCLLSEPRTLTEINRDIVINGGKIFEASVRRPASQANTGENLDETTLSDSVHEKEPIAVVGIGLRFPGSSTPEAFWDQILSGRSGICEVPEERWRRVSDYYDPDRTKADKSYTRIGGFIKDFEFDPLKYRIPPTVACKMDRTQQLAVACAGDALEDAGLSREDLKGIRVGVMIGNSMGGETTDLYAQRLGLPHALHCLDRSLGNCGPREAQRDSLKETFTKLYLDGLPDITEDSLPGELANVISGRVANVFNLTGPNFTVDAACASSMAAVLSSVRALREGSIDFAVTGGVDAAMGPSSFIKFCKIGALSPDGSRPFDESANGFVMGEGAGMMVLKRLSDALRDGDRIYATILEIGSSSDGKGKGITAPNPEGQSRALTECYTAAGIDPCTVGLIEAHGTSTPVGDQTELKVMDKFFRDSSAPGGSVGIGSVKSQIGHLKAAAGAAGMIKAILSLYHRTLPPTANVNSPTQCIQWRSSPLLLLREKKKWERTNGIPRRAGVSAFGFGGTNFHALIQEYSPDLRVIKGGKSRMAKKVFSPPKWHMPDTLSVEGEAWVVGGLDPRDASRRIREIVGKLNDGTFRSLAASTRAEACRLPFRWGFAARDAAMAQEKLALVVNAIADSSKKPFFAAKGISFHRNDPGARPKAAACLFPGQGSQYPYMLRDLAQRFPVVADTFIEADDVLTKLGLPSITGALFPDPSGPDKSRSIAGDPLRDTQLLQPMILTADTAIFRLLQLVGLTPVAVAGHSLGEYAACVAAGVFSFRVALEAVSVRGREMARVSIADPGLMMSIPADARVIEDVLSRVDGYVVAANKNSPKQTVISGETEAVKKAGEIFQSMGLEGTLVPVSAAFHSGVVAPAREPFMKTLRQLEVNTPSVPILSNVTGDFYPAGPSSEDRIRDLLGKQFAAPVEWVKSLRRMRNEGIEIFVECGPKRVLTNFTIDTLGKEVYALPTNHPKKGGVMQLLEAISALMTFGVPVDLERAEREENQAYSTGEIPGNQAPRVLEVSTLPSSQTSSPNASREESLAGLIDEEIRQLAGKAEFQSYLDLQGEFLRSVIKSGFQSFSEKILPMQATVKKVESEGFDFQPVVVTGTAVGLPHDVRFPFDKETLEELLSGKNFIKRVSDDSQKMMCEMNIERLVKGPSGEAEMELVTDVNGVIKLAGFFREEDPIVSHYGIEERVAQAMDVTTRLAVAAGIEALRDAGIPLMRSRRTTTTGQELLDSWALPPGLRSETGVIFASAFPGMASLVDEVTREISFRYGSGARKRLINFYAGLLERITDDRERETLSEWFSSEFAELSFSKSDDCSRFNRSFLLRVMSMAHGQLAQLIKAQGPNTHLDAACAGTTQAILLARDWIRTGQASRVIVIAADDVAGRSLLPWVGSGFLSMGAATVEGNVAEAALPFDERRHGLILGSAAVGLVLEKAELPAARGLEPIVSIEAGIAANSGFHGTRLDVDHICATMERMIAKWERESGRFRTDLAEDVFFMSHETYSPKRGGSSAAEIAALKSTFGQSASRIPIANTKGYTGHTMGVGVEDVVAMRCLQKGLLPPIPNLRQPDPDFAGMNLSKGGPLNAQYALRLAAGFGSQIVMALYKVLSKQENRLTDISKHRDWLQSVTGYAAPVVTVEERTLRVGERQVAAREEDHASMPTVAEMKEATGSVRCASTQNIFEEVKEAVLKLLAEKTGYPQEMLDTGLDLEADLGIDTVKQAEFISEVRTKYGIPRIEGLKIAEYPTIQHIVQFVVSHCDGGLSSECFSETGHEDIPALETESRYDGVKRTIIGMLAEKTGYPQEMLDGALDLEADLGIDTVKQAEFISELRSFFNIPRVEGLKIADFATINHLVEFVELNSSIGRETPSVGIVQQEDKAEVFDHSQGTDGFIRRYETRLISMQAPSDTSDVMVDEILILGGSAEIQEAFRSQFLWKHAQEVRILQSPGDVRGTQRSKVGIVNLFALQNDMDCVAKTFELYRVIAGEFEKGPVFLAAVVSQDGAFGFEDPTEEGYQAGAVSGATKAFAREYPECIVRVIDVHPDLGSEEKTGSVGLSLHPDFPVEACVNGEGVFRTVRLIPSLMERPLRRNQFGEVILVTGGARGIAASCLKALAGDHAHTFVLLGRTPLSERAEKLSHYTGQDWEGEKRRIMDRFIRRGENPTPVKVDGVLRSLRAEAEVFETLSELRSRGAEVVYRSVDIMDASTVDVTIGEILELCGRIDVVVHSAGIDASRALRSKTLEEMMNVFQVKVQGIRNVLGALEVHGIAPRQVIGFGSISGRFGNQAQVDYSAANDALSHLLRWVQESSDIKTTTLAWAPWAEVGMAARGSVQKTLESMGIDFISPRTGSQILVDELNDVDGTGGEIIVAGNLGPFGTETLGTTGRQSATSLREDELNWAGQRVIVDELVPGEYLKARIFLDPSLPLLDHHRIDRACVLPGVGGLEFMQSAVEHLDPGVQNVGFEDVEFVSPLKIFRNSSLEAEIEVVKVPDRDPLGVYQARITSCTTQSNGTKIGNPRVHHRARITSHAEESAQGKDSLRPGRYIFVSDRDIYGIFFHGPAFRFLDHVLIDPTEGDVRFRYQGNSLAESMFSSFIPGAVESAFQACAALGLETHHVMALPVAVQRVTIYRTDSRPCSGVFTLVRTSHDTTTGRKIFQYDGCVKDSEDRPIVALNGLEMIGMEDGASFPRRILESIYSSQELLKSSKNSSSIPEGFDETEFAEHPPSVSAKRANEWIAGRLALKKTVRSLLEESDNPPVALEDIRIVQDGQGKPCATTSRTTGDPVCEVSLSHSNGLVMAAAGRLGDFRGLGIDVEKVEDRGSSWTEDYFTDQEQAGSDFTPQKSAYFTQVWCIKEAVLKALGVGLRVDLRDMDVRIVNESGRATVEFRNGASQQFSHVNNKIEARAEVREGIVIARALIRDDQEDPMNRTSG